MLAIPLLDAGLKVLDTIIERLFPDPAERDKARALLMEMQQKGELAQLTVNAEEAKHSSIFVAGWRPAIGWTCAGAFAWAFVLQPLLVFVAALSDYPLPPLPVLGLGELMPVLLGMLGLGTLRSYEKVSGVATGMAPVAAPTPLRR